MNNITIINPFTSHNSNIANIKTQHSQIMTTITNIILKFKPMIKKPIVPNHAYFTFIIFGRIRLNILLVARCSLVSARCLLLFTRCSLLSARCSLLFYFLLAARWFFLVGHYFLLVTRYFIGHRML